MRTLKNKISGLFFCYAKWNVSEYFKIVKYMMNCVILKYCSNKLTTLCVAKSNVGENNEKKESRKKLSVNW